MREDKSQFLHSLRWIAALVVVLGHAQLIGAGSSSALAFIGSFDHAAVMVFFVLSGYVIAATVERKRAAGYRLRDYFLDRGSRIYSVLVPALVLTIILDGIGAHVFPERYADPSLVPQTQWLLRLGVNVLCLQGMWGYRVQFGTDAALWSIGYEFCYYVLFALYMWRPKCWSFMAAAILLIVGPWVAIYGLVWAMGVVAYRAGLQTSWMVAVPLTLVAAFVLEHQVSPVPEVVRDLLFGVVVMVLVTSALTVPKSLSALNRKLADFSYSAYAYHMPIMFLALGFVPATALRTLTVVAATLLLARALFYVTEDQRGLLRRALDRLLPGRALVTAAA